MQKNDIIRMAGVYYRVESVSKHFLYVMRIKKGIVLPEVVSMYRPQTEDNIVQQTKRALKITQNRLRSMLNRRDSEHKIIHNICETWERVCEERPDVLKLYDDFGNCIFVKYEYICKTVHKDERTGKMVLTITISGITTL